MRHENLPQGIRRMPVLRQTTPISLHLFDGFLSLLQTTPLRDVTNDTWLSPSGWFHEAFVGPTLRTFVGPTLRTIVRRFSYINKFSKRSQFVVMRTIVCNAFRILYKCSELRNMANVRRSYSFLRTVRTPRETGFRCTGLAMN